MEFLRELRLQRSRKELLQASNGASVTHAAVSSGFNHLARFAARYRARYGENPSATLQRSQMTVGVPFDGGPVVRTTLERPSIAVLPFNLVGSSASAVGGGIADDIVAALIRVGWMAVRPAARDAQYHLGGTVRDNGTGGLGVTVTLLDAVAGRYLWIERWEGQDRSDVFGFTDRIGSRVVPAIEQSVCAVEIGRASRQNMERRNAWQLTLGALPRVLSTEPGAQDVALELLEEAMDYDSQDPLPIAIAAFCRGLRGAHAFCERPQNEKKVALDLASRAAHLNAGRDPLIDTMLASGYCLANDLAAAALHVDRALAVHSGSAWAWGRSGWIKAYNCDAAAAIERFLIARALAPADPLDFLCSVGIAVGHFCEARYEQSICWFEHGLKQNPAAVWINNQLTAAYALAGRKEDAQRCFNVLRPVFPELTIAQVRAGLPFRSGYLDRVAEGLDVVGMRAY